LVDDAIELSQRLRPRLATALSWWLTRLREDLRVMERSTLRDLPRGPRFQAEALVASLQSCLDRLFGRGRLNIDLQNGAVVEQALHQLRELWQPLAPVAYLARLTEQVSRIAEEPYGALWTSLQAGVFTGLVEGQNFDCKWWERPSRQLQVREGCEAIFRDMTLNALARIDQAIAHGADAIEVADCASALRLAWVDAWTEVRVLSRDFQPLDARERWLRCLDEAMRSSVTLAGRIELHLRGTCTDCAHSASAAIAAPTQAQVAAWVEI
jgi:hypothetical protein